MEPSTGRISELPLRIAIPPPEATISPCPETPFSSRTRESIRTPDKALPSSLPFFSDTPPSPPTYGSRRILSGTVRPVTPPHHIRNKLPPVKCYKVINRITTNPQSVSSRPSDEVLETQLNVLKREMLSFIGREKEATGRVAALEAFGDEVGEAELAKWRREIKEWRKWSIEWKKRVDDLEAELENRNARAQKRMGRVWDVDKEEGSALSKALSKLDLGNSERERPDW